jgi:hypothetical protein
MMRKEVGLAGRWEWLAHKAISVTNIDKPVRARVVISWEKKFQYRKELFISFLR